MDFRRRISRLARGLDRKRDADGEARSLDRRHYDRAWRWLDRRAVAPALMGASMLLPELAEATPPARGPDHDPEGARAREAGDSALDGVRLYVNPDGPASHAAGETSGDDAALLGYIAAQPTATWFGDWNTDVARDADRVMERAQRRGQVPLLVAYNLPNRDCTATDPGGAGSADGYREWIRDFARGIGEQRAVVVLEPYALSLVSCLTHEARSERFSLLREAVDVLKGRTDAVVYIAAGHPRWVDAEEMAQRLYLAGISHADGFALNVGNYVATEHNLSYGDRLALRLGGIHFIVDTGRNGGHVRTGEWCNPRGAALGSAPTTDTGHPLADAFLWIKQPGESDGRCNGGPEAGDWWPEYALAMARRAHA